MLSVYHTSVPYLWGVYTTKQTSSKHLKQTWSKREANLEHTSCTCIFRSFASCLLHRVNTLLNRFKCHLAVTLLLESNNTPCQMGLKQKARFGVELPANTCNYKLQLNRQSYAATWRIQTRNWLDFPQRFHLLPNYSSPC